jgi:hypothetical protein
MESDTIACTSAPVEVEETNSLISSGKIDRMVVYDRNGDRLGTIHHLMINKLTGQVAYAVMSFSGFMGMGRRYHPLPWAALTFDARIGGFVVDTDRQRLEAARRYTAGDRPTWSDRADTGRIAEYWIGRV